MQKWSRSCFSLQLGERNACRNLSVVWRLFLSFSTTLAPISTEIMQNHWQRTLSELQEARIMIAGCDRCMKYSQSKSTRPEICKSHGYVSDENVRRRRGPWPAFAEGWIMELKGNSLTASDYSQTQPENKSHVTATPTQLRPHTPHRLPRQKNHNQQSWSATSHNPFTLCDPNWVKKKTKVDQWYLLKNLEFLLRLWMVSKTFLRCQKSHGNP